MTNKELLNTIRSHKGEIVVGMLVRNDVIYVKAVKSDLIKALRDTPDNIATASSSKGNRYVLYVDAA